MEKKERFNAREKINLLHQRLEWFQSKPYSCWFVINNINKELMLAYKEEECFGDKRTEKNGLSLVIVTPNSFTSL